MRWAASPGRHGVGRAVVSVRFGPVHERWSRTSEVSAREDGVMVEDCPFCSVDPTEVIALEGSCLAIRTGEPPEGSLMILPAAHRVAPWDLTAAEWDDTGTLLRSLSDRLLDSHRPDGFTVGWNVGPVGGQSIPHAHCHLVPRYADEPYAGRGLRWWLKQPENLRPK